MGVESADDILDFFVTDDFAVTAQYEGDDPLFTVDVVGIFEDAQASRNVSNMAGVSIPAVTFVCRTSDIDGNSEGKSLFVEGTAYIIRAAMTDGTGITTVMLEEA